MYNAVIEELEILKIKGDIASRVRDKLSDDEKKFILTNQLKMIKRELGYDESEDT